MGSQLHLVSPIITLKRHLVKNQECKQLLMYPSYKQEINSICLAVKNKKNQNSFSIYFGPFQTVIFSNAISVGQDWRQQ